MGIENIQTLNFGLGSGCYRISNVEYHLSMQLKTVLFTESETVGNLAFRGVDDIISKIDRKFNFKYGTFMSRLFCNYSDRAK